MPTDAEPGPAVPTLRHGDTLYRLPFVALFRAHTAAERERLLASVRARGVRVRVVTYTSPAWGRRCVIDGATRLAVAAELGRDLPVADLGDMADDAARDLALTLNADRRHLSLDEQAAARAVRIGRVRAARDEGRSLREIAAAEGVSHVQVLRDLAVEHGLQAAPAGGTGVPPAPPDPVARLRRAVRAVSRPGRDGPAGALALVLADPARRAALAAAAARHGVPLDGDRWPLVETLQAVLAELDGAPPPAPGA